MRAARAQCSLHEAHPIARASCTSPLAPPRRSNVARCWDRCAGAERPAARRHRSPTGSRRATPRPRLASPAVPPPDPDSTSAGTPAPPADRPRLQTAVNLAPSRAVVARHVRRRRPGGPAPLFRGCPRSARMQKTILPLFLHHEHVAGRLAGGFDAQAISARVIPLRTDAHIAERRVGEHFTGDRRPLACGPEAGRDLLDETRSVFLLEPREQQLAHQSVEPLHVPGVREARLDHPLHHDLRTALRSRHVLATTSFAQVVDLLEHGCGAALALRCGQQVRCLCIATHAHELVRRTRERA